MLEQCNEVKTKTHTVLVKTKLCSMQQSYIYLPYHDIFITNVLLSTPVPHGEYQ